MINYKKLKIGQLVEVEDGELENGSMLTTWGFITYLYGGDGKEFVSIVGWGKSESCPVITHSILNIKNVKQNALSYFHNLDHILWCDRIGLKFYYTMPLEYSEDGFVYSKNNPNVYFKFRMITETGELEYINRTDMGYGYQLNNLVLIERFKKEPSREVIFNKIKNFNRTRLYRLKEKIFPKPKKLLKEDTYYDEVFYHKIIEDRNRSYSPDEWNKL